MRENNKLSLIVGISFGVILFLGFGLIHANTVFLEKTGSVMIGLGAFYFIIRILLSLKK